jgi:subtilase family serine protease
VIAVGGTSLTLDKSGNYGSGSAWSGSGGGLSKYEYEPVP